MPNEIENPGDDAEGAITPEATPQPSGSAQEAIERAFAGLGDDEGAESEPASGGPSRGPDGRFAAKVTEARAEAPQPQTDAGAFDVPQRFSADAKAAWEQTPVPVRAEIGRAMREMEGGLRQYQERFEPLRPFEEMAQQNGTTIQQALSNYVGMEQMLRQDPIAGLERVCQNMGFRLADVAAHVMGQPAPQRDQVIDGLNQQIAALQQQVGGVQQTFQQQRHRETTDMVSAFASQNPRFDELAGEIAQLIQTGYASDLQDAYDKAERLNPAPAAPSTAVAPPTAPADPAQTRKSALSIHGAPTSGSNPANRQRSATAADAIESAFSQLGIG